MHQTTRGEEFTSNPSVLHLALELSCKEWKLAFASSVGQRPRLRTLAAGDLESVLQEIARAKVRLGLPEGCRVVSCYEAGRDGFWLHRWLLSQGVENRVVDSSSIEVNRRSRRAKTDRLDAQKLLTQLIRFTQGEEKAFSVLRVPSPEQEDVRQGPRELSSLKKERTLHTNRLKGLLASQGVRLPVRRDFLEQLEQVRLWDGRPVPDQLKQRLQREHERLLLLQQQIKDLERQRREALRQASLPQDHQKVQKLLRLRAIGDNSSWLLVCEVFGWRQFKNRRELGGASGFAPMPYQSGTSDHDQGISKAGNRRVRAMLIEIAWAWLRFQPQSRLTLWFQQRFGPVSGRSRRVGIVALARRLLIALWRYVHHDIVPDGAVLKSA
jgi:transposase